MRQNLRNFTRAMYGFDAVAQRVGDDQWGADSPCEGWTARDVVAHLCGTIEALTKMARTGEVAMPATPDVGDDPIGYWNTTRDDVLATLDQPGVINTEGAFWWGPMSIDRLLAFVQWDPLGHSWDLAQATGQDAHGADEVAESAIATIEPMADTLRKMNLMGDPVDVPADADAMTRFLGLTGRDPSR